jgi:hypothetical protein
MKFTEEDGIIPAYHALYRSHHGVEDSLDREDIRTIMGYIKRSSGYGYRETLIMSQHRIISQVVIEEIEKLGYTIKCEVRPHWNEKSAQRGMVQYDWRISW